MYTYHCCQRIFNNLPVDDKPELEQYKGVLLSADNSPIKVYGRAQMNVRIGKKSMRHPVLIADISNEGLIGTDFLKTHRMILDFAANKVWCDGDLVVARCQEGTNRACRISVAETTVIPAGTRTILEGKAVKPLATGSLVVEPLSTSNKKVLTARAIIQGAGTRMPVEVMNPLDEDVVLYKHTNLGVLSRLPEQGVICSLTEDPSGRIELPSPDLPEELELLLQKIEVEVSEVQKQEIRQLLKEHQEVLLYPDNH